MVVCMQTEMPIRTNKCTHSKCTCMSVEPCVHSCNQRGVSGPLSSLPPVISGRWLSCAVQPLRREGRAWVWTALGVQLSGQGGCNRIVNDICAIRFENHVPGSECRWSGRVWMGIALTQLAGSSRRAAMPAGLWKCGGGNGGT